MVFTIFFFSFFLYSPWNSPGQNTGVGSHSPSPGDLPNLGIEPRSPSLQADPLPAEPRGKSKNTGVGSLSLLQGMSPTQESNQGLLNCRWILYLSALREAPLLDNMLVQIWELQSYTDRIRHLKSKSVTCSVMSNSLKPHGL